MVKSARRGIYEPSPQYVPRRLQRRLTGEWDKNLSWEKIGQDYYDPPDVYGATRIHKPGSQNPRK